MARIWIAAILVLAILFANNLMYHVFGNSHAGSVIEVITSVIHLPIRS